jgi:hypothetical protein
MMTPQWITRLVLVALLCSGIYLSQQTGPHDGDLSDAPEATAQQQTGGLTIRLKPGFDADQPSPAEIDLIGKLLPEILTGMASGKKENAG